MTLLRVVVMQNPNYSNCQKVIFDVCVTRWLENLDGFSMFLTTLPYIVETLEVIGYQLHLDKYPEWHDWDAESKRRAVALLGNFFSVFIIIGKICFFFIALKKTETNKILSDR